MGASIEFYPPPNDPVAFESLCLDLWKHLWNHPGADKNGRRGQRQDGVDVYGQQGGLWRGIQCKQKDGLLRHKVTVEDLEVEVTHALNFEPKLASFILATTGPADATLQKRARELTEDHRKDGLFTVEVWSWPKIWHEIYTCEELFRRITPIYWPGTFRIIDALSKLPNTPDLIVVMDLKALDGYPTLQHPDTQESILCGGFKARITLQHRRTAGKLHSIIVSSISLELESFDDTFDDRLAYKVNVLKTIPRGFIALNCFTVQVGGRTVHPAVWHFVDSAVKAPSGSPCNILETAPPSAIKIDSGSDDSVHFQGFVRMTIPGLYRLKFLFKYNIGGQQAEIATGAMYVYTM